MNRNCTAAAERRSLAVCYGDKHKGGEIILCFICIGFMPRAESERTAVWR